MNYLLIVDDDDAVLRVLRRLLELDGFKVEEFTDPAAAVRAFEADPFRYSLVITDIMMPNMTGTELVAKILKRRPEIGVVFITGFAIAADLSGMDLLLRFPVLAKPGQIPTLPERVRDLLEMECRLAGEPLLLPAA